MSVELSPQQESRLHSILDRGIESIKTSFDLSPVRSSCEESGTRLSSHRSDLQDEMQSLKNKLDKLETIITQKAFTASLKAASSKKVIRKRIPVLSKVSSSSSLRKKLETTEKEIRSLEKTITPSQRTPRREKVTPRKENPLTFKLTRENQRLKKKLKKQDNLRAKIIKLQEDYNQMTVNLKKSESVRKKQRQIIEELKRQLQIESGEPTAVAIANPPKPKHRR